MRVGVVVLPEWPWKQAATVWRQVEELGFDHAWTYDHLSWRTLRDGTWYGTVTTLSAAAVTTSRIRLGTLVASPNYRHPVPFSREVMSLDDLSGGRFTLGLGAGTLAGYDNAILGGQPRTPRERTARYAEFVRLLDRLLTEPMTTDTTGEYYRAVEMPNHPGCVQRPRVPFALAGSGPRGMRLAARYGQGWITLGADAERPDALDPAGRVAAVREQVERLEAACAEAGRDPAELARYLLLEAAGERPLDDPARFADLAGAYGEAGITDLVLHYPRAGEPYAGSVTALERLAALRRG
ncbi:MAG: LLM class flavin-dependent oxidoreductase [Mycobacteriales bacterium]